MCIRKGRKSDTILATVDGCKGMRVFGEGMVYQDWVEDLECYKYIMGMGLNDEVKEENLDLNEWTQKGLGIESSTQFGSSKRIKEEPVPAVFRGRGNSRPGGVTRDSQGTGRGFSCFKCGGVYPHDHLGCPAAENQCQTQTCNRWGHLKEFCNQRNRGSYYGHHTGRGGVNNVTYDDEEQEYDNVAIDEGVQSLQAATDK